MTECFAGAIFVHDIEFQFEEGIEKAWADPAVRAASGAKTLEEFQGACFREWTSWFALPCPWAKERYPGTPVGIYRPQPFRRDYRGVAGKSARPIDGTHRMDHELWRRSDRRSWSSTNPLPRSGRGNALS